jgi:hypothetical protein
LDGDGAMVAVSVRAQAFDLKRLRYTNAEIAYELRLNITTVAKLFCDDPIIQSAPPDEVLRERKCLRCGEEIVVPRLIFRCLPCRKRD